MQFKKEEIHILHVILNWKTKKYFKFGRTFIVFMENIVIVKY